MAGTTKRLPSDFLVRGAGGTLAGTACEGHQPFDLIETGFGNGPAADVTSDLAADGKLDVTVANGRRQRGRIGSGGP
jgi:hypothetical protein